MELGVRISARRSTQSDVVPALYIDAAAFDVMPLAVVDTSQEVPEKKLDGANASMMAEIRLIVRQAS